MTNALLASTIADRGLTALEPAAAENRNGMVVTADTAADLELRTISDLAPWAGSMVFGGPPECPERDLCLPGLEQIYGLHFESFLPLDTGGPLSADAIQRGTVDVGMLFTTDGMLAGDDLVLLRDDRHLQPAESVTPIVRADTLERFGGGVRSALDTVSDQLTTEDLRQMNASVSAGAVRAGGTASRGRHGPRRDATGTSSSFTGSAWTSTAGRMSSSTGGTLVSSSSGLYPPPATTVTVTV